MQRNQEKKKKRNMNAMNEMNEMNKMKWTKWTKQVIGAIFGEIQNKQAFSHMWLITCPVGDHMVLTFRQFPAFRPFSATFGHFPTFSITSEPLDILTCIQTYTFWKAQGCCESPPVYPTCLHVKSSQKYFFTPTSSNPIKYLEMHPHFAENCQNSILQTDIKPI